MQLNGWQRIGIVASVVWAIGAGYYQRNADLKLAEVFMSANYQLCTDRETQTKDFDFTACAKERASDYDLALRGSWPNVLFVSLVPIPLGWLGIYLVMKVWRWVRAGFSNA